MKGIKFRWKEVPQGFIKPKSTDAIDMTWFDMTGHPHNMLAQLQYQVDDGDWQTVAVEYPPMLGL